MKKKTTDTKASDKFSKLISIKNSVPIEIPQFIKNPLNLSHSKWVSFGRNNQFPNEIAYLNRTSPVHSGILLTKCNYVSGSDIIYKDENLKKQFTLINNNRENLQDIALNYFRSFFGLGNTYIHIITDKKRSFFSLFILDYTMCRIGCDTDKGFILIHPDFKDTIYAEQPYKIAQFPEFSPSKTGYLESVYMVNNMVDGFRPYGLADWMASIDSAETNKAVDNGNKNKAMTGDWITTFVSAQFTSLKEAEEMVENYRIKKQGNENAGGVHFIAQGVGASPTTISDTGVVKDGFFESLNASTKENLIIAHNWFPSLVASNKNTGFDTNVILNEYSIAKNTVIEKNQKSFLEIINEIYLKLFNKDITDQILFVNKPPVIDKTCMRIWEYRKEIGVYVEGDENVPEFQALMGQTNKATF